MIIQKMNNVLVKHGKITFAIFTTLIIVSFVLYVGSTSLFELLSGPTSVNTSSKYGSVLGRDISINDVGNARQTVCVFCAALYGQSPQRVQSPDEDYSFAFAVLAKAADALNIQASNDEVREVIQTMPAFRKDGKFSTQLYNDYRTNRLAPAGLGFSDLEDAVRSMIRMKKVPGATRFLLGYLRNYTQYIDFLEFSFIFFEGIPELMTANVILPDSEAATNAELLLQKISYHLITFDPDSFEDQVKVEESDVKDFYTANPSYFMSEPESDGLLAFAPFTEKTTEVTEEQMKDYYDLNKDSYLKEDGSEQTFDEVKDAISKKLGTTVDYEEAEAQMRAFNKAFRAALKADKEEGNPDDPLKHFRDEAEKAGLKITEVKNITAQTEADAELHIDHELVDAITILKNVGSYTNPVNGEKGISMFLMTARRPSVLQPYEDVKDKAQKMVVAQRKRAQAEEAAAQLGLKFLELKDAPAEIEALVKSLNGVWHAENTQTRFEIMSIQYRPAVKEILTTDVGKLSSPNKLLDYPVFVFVSAHTPATAEEIAERKEDLDSELKALKQDYVSLGLQSWVLGSAQNNSSRARYQE